LQELGVEIDYPDRYSIEKTEQKEDNALGLRLTSIPELASLNYNNGYFF